MTGHVANVKGILSGLIVESRLEEGTRVVAKCVLFKNMAFTFSSTFTFHSIKSMYGSHVEHQCGLRNWCKDTNDQPNGNQTCIGE